MKIGIDLDNTIAIYDNLISNLASIINIPTILKNKKDIANYLRDNDREDQWTKLQGLIYGPLMEFAEVAEGFLEAISYLSNLGGTIIIISHRTHFSQYDGLYDLHFYASRWIDQKIISKIHNKNIKIIFAQTIDKKIQSIVDEKVDYFIDDLPKILHHINFPITTKKILYSELETDNKDFLHLNNWLKIKNLINN